MNVLEEEYCELGEIVHDAMVNLSDNLLFEGTSWIEEFAGFNFKITIERLD